MKFLFIIQGEGRGHLTQAIALAELIRGAGHQVCGALVGSADGQRVQNFFREAFGAEITPFASPALVYNRKTKALSLPHTLTAAGRHLPRYLSGLRKIRQVVNVKQPDLVINFYDVLGGLHSRFFPQKCPMICVAHQYLMQHRHFEHPKGHALDRFLVNLNSCLTALGAARKLALSFYPGESDGNIRIVPPLLRQDLWHLDTPEENFFLAYVTQQAMAEGIMDWQQRHPEVEVHCFTDGPLAGEVRPNLHFHPIDAGKFLERMRTCRGLISTAGFESVAEAMLLGKPVLMVPLRRHYEQTCNAVDAERAGAGIYRPTFDADALLALEYTPRHEFRAWVEKAGPVFLREALAVTQEVRTKSVRIPATIMETPPMMRA